MNKIFLQLIILVIFIFIGFVGCAKINAIIPVDFQLSWNCYKNTFLTNDGRVVDFERNAVSTSEGQAYAMLRAVMINDRDTFDKVYQWSNNNLKRPNDNLYSWLWGKTKDGRWAILDHNSATDADIDIAFSLILASDKWNQNFYLDDAKKIISDIWDYETKIVDINSNENKFISKRILTSGYEQTKSSIQEINPSYFTPYAFRFFGKYDKTHNWQKLVDSSYFLINKATSLTNTHLPPNWFLINEKTGEISIDKTSSNSDFSYDAVRTFIRFYVDYLVFNDKRDDIVLSKISFFNKKWKQDKELHTNYKYNGNLRDKDKCTGSIALLVPIFDILDKNIAKDIYSKEIDTNYNKDGFWNMGNNYYESNLSWFGTWIYFNKKNIRDGLRKIYEK